MLDGIYAIRSLVFASACLTMFHIYDNHLTHERMLKLMISESRENDKHRLHSRFDKS